MAVPSNTATGRDSRGPGRPPRQNLITPAVRASAPTKWPKYIPGGPGGGGRYINPNTGTEIPKDIAIPLLRAAGRRHSARRPQPVQTSTMTRNGMSDVTSPTRQPTRPRRGRPGAGPRTGSASAAAAVAENDGYKPREERGWEEFHQGLDIGRMLVVYSADEVDGVRSSVPKPTTPCLGLARSASAPDDGATPNGTPTLAAQTSQLPDDKGDGIRAHSILEQSHVSATVKRRPGRPPRRPGSMLTGLGSPPMPKIEPLPTKDKREKLSLSKPSYRKVDTFSHYEQDPFAHVNYVDRTMAVVGYQESDRFCRPEQRLVRMQDGVQDDFDVASSLENDIHGHSIGRVEYDMDEQDERWLEALNAQRKEEQAEPIKPAIFEITMTQLEKHWHVLEKRIPKPNPKPPQTHRQRAGSASAVNGEPIGNFEEQDTKCAVCDDGDCENTNAIVFCDGCDLAVHQECYGVPFIPEGQWLCRKCQLIGRGIPTCIFCPNVDGAFKQTANPERWSHLLCAIWIPEISLGNTTFMEPVMDVEKVPRQRWKLQCYICDQRMGACIQCGNRNCYSAFHVTCARRARLFLRMKSAHSGSAKVDASVLKAFCHRHGPSEWRRENDVEAATREAMSFYRRTMRGRQWAERQTAVAHTTSNTMNMDDFGGNAVQAPSSNKRKLGHPSKGVWRMPSGSPVVPQLMFDKVEGSLVRFNVRKRKEYVAEACRYWTLKREARRGAALLKRLQLQMERFSSMEITRRNFAAMGAAGRLQLHRRRGFADCLVKDMRKLEELCYHVRRREQNLLNDVHTLKSIVDTVYFPIYPLLWPILRKAQSLDSKDVFKEDLDVIQTRLEDRYYKSVSEFSVDLGAICLDTAHVQQTREHPNGTNGCDVGLSMEQKDQKKLIKRIIKAISPALKDATTKEAQLSGEKSDHALREPHSARLDNSWRSQPSPTRMTEIHIPRQHVTMYNLMGQPNESVINGNGRYDCDAKKTSFAEQGHSVHGRGDAVMQLQFRAPEESTEGRSGVSGGECPVIQHGNPDTAHSFTISLDPLTSPQYDDNTFQRSENSVPWYLRSFDPRGTTIYDETWPGRDVLRDMSEELSEIDDAELDGMLGDDDVADEVANAPSDVADTDDGSVRDAHRLKARVKLQRNSPKRA